jgi:hypothetical protein
LKGYFVGIAEEFAAVWKRGKKISLNILNTVVV